MRGERHPGRKSHVMARLCVCREARALEQAPLPKGQRCSAHRWQHRGGPAPVSQGRALEMVPNHTEQCGSPGGGGATASKPRWRQPFLGERASTGDEPQRQVINQNQLSALGVLEKTTQFPKGWKESLWQWRTQVVPNLQAHAEVSDCVI